MGVCRGDAAAEQDFCAGTGGAHALHMRRVSLAASAGAGDDQPIRKAAIQRVVRGIFQGPIAQRNGVFDVDVRKDLRVGTDVAAKAERMEGIALDDSLVGEHRAAMDVHADEFTAASRAQRQRGAGIVAQDIETDGQRNRLAHGATNGRHGSNGFGANRAFSEGNVAEVLDENRMRAALLVSLGVGDGMFCGNGQISAPAGRTGQWRQMNNADEEFAMGLKEHAPFSPMNQECSSGMCQPRMKHG